MSIKSQVNPIDWPRCGKCGMPVEDFYVLENIGASRSITITLVALCHNEREEVTVPDDLIEADMRPDSITLGTAFNNEQEIKQLCPINGPEKITG